MDYIKDLNTYDKCKHILKSWEKDFKKHNGRIPSKLDIREADKHIRDAYKTYFQLKTSAIEKSLQDTDLFSDDEKLNESNHKIDDTGCEIKNDSIFVPQIEEPSKANEKIWGEHLLIKEKETCSEKKLRTVKSCFTEKLLKNTKPLGRFTRKSLSFHKKKSENNLSQEKALSQPNPVDFHHDSNTNQRDDILDNCEGEVSALFSYSIHQKPLEVKVTNVIQSILTNNYKKRDAIDKNWLNRIIPWELNNIETNDEENLEDNSEDIIAESDEEDALHVAKKLKINNEVVAKEVITETTNSHESLNSRKDFSQPVNNKQIIENFNDKGQQENTDKCKKLPKTSRNLKRINFKESSDDEDPYNLELESESSDDDNIRKKAMKKQNAPKTPKRNNNKSSKNDKPDTNKKESYELEYSIENRISSNPRIKNIKKAITTAVIVKEKLKRGITSDIGESQTQSNPSVKESVEEKKLLNKIESGKLNENFVSLNLKKKIFVRGKKNMNFSKYKKKQWKEKKKELYGVVTSNCSTDARACFTCGESGHWARQCPMKKGEELLPLEADVEESVCPTLEEAAQMASKSLLVVRKPNFDKNVMKNDEKILENDEIDENDEFEDDLPIAVLNEVDRIEEEVRKVDMNNYIDSASFVKPFYEEKITETPQEVYDALSKFGFSEFRGGQEKAIVRILSGLSTLVTLSTGAGKSLCYQLPAYLYSKKETCITLVVSPLVSLMEDQVQGIPAFLKAACLHTGQTKTQKEKVQAAIDSGSLDILLVSPEAIVAGERSAGLGSLLRKLPPIAFACIDEIHCVSQWSHNFRPSYLMLCRVLRERLGIKTILGLTATATRSTCDSIVEHLCIPDGKEGIISDIPLPKNLHLSVSRDVNRDQALLNLLTSEIFENNKSIIVYCTRREECERIATLIRTTLREPAGNGVKRKRYSSCAEPYHAGLSASRRKIVQKSFMNGELRIVVATVAFGMGINKSDIRSVIHYNLPSSIESYVQEVGRAGRDGLPSYCHLFLNAENSDEYELRRHVHANTVDRHSIRKLIQRIFIPCSCKGLCTRHEVAFSIQETVQALDIPEENIATLLCYLELHKNKFVEVLSNAYISCKVISYGGVAAIAHASKECIPLAMALALHKNNLKDNIFEFPVIDVAAAIGWDSGICKHKLKNLEWTTVNNQPTRSKLSVQFSNLGFRVLAPGNLSDSELDEALEYLSKRVQDQEKRALLQINIIKNAITSVAVPSVSSTPISDEPLKVAICDYFENPAVLESESKESEVNVIDEGRIANDARSLIVKFMDTNFTGRAIARIFHGIQSPNYPAFEWSRCGFWRSHIQTDFNVVCRIATKEIIRMNN